MNSKIKLNVINKYNKSKIEENNYINNYITSMHTINTNIGKIYFFFICKNLVPSSMIKNKTCKKIVDSSIRKSRYR